MWGGVGGGGKYEADDLNGSLLWLGGRNFTGKGKENPPERVLHFHHPDSVIRSVYAIFTS